MDALFLHRLKIQLVHSSGKEEPLSRRDPDGEAAHSLGKAADGNRWLLLSSDELP